MPRGLRASVSAAGAGGVALPTAIFDLDTNTSITPTTGSAGTYTRASDQYYATGLSTLAKVTSGNPAVGAVAHQSEYTTLVNGGIPMYGAVTNWLQYSDELATAPWTKSATAAVVNDSTRGPYDPGADNASLLVGAAAGDYVDQDSAVTAASSTFAFGVWLKGTDAGPHNVDIVIQDEAGSPAGTARTVAVTGTWKQFVVRQAFGAGATGTAHAKIIVGNTSGGGYAIYAFGAGLYGVKSTQASDIRWDFKQVPYIPTTNAAASMAESLLHYHGAEITASFSQVSIGAWFYFCDHDPAQAWDSKYIFRLYDSGWADLCSFMFVVSDNNIWVSYGNNSFVNTGDVPTHGQWHHVMVTTKSGDSETFLNGVSIHTDANAWATRAGDYLLLGKDWHSGGHGYTQPGPIIIGRTQVYDTRLSATQALAVYNSQKAGYGR